MVGSNKLPEKERRRFRRANHIACDLRTPKYRQRVVKNKRKEDYIEDYNDEEE